MKVLIFGTTGQVAQELKRHAPQGVDVSALGRDRVDLSDPKAAADAIIDAHPDIVINAAAYTAVDRAEEEPELAHIINGDASGVMARACASQNIPFLHISTDYVFDGAGNTSFSPNHPTAPINSYGRSKLAGEQAIVAAGGPFAILRTSWVFSSHGQNFVRTMLRLSETRDQLSIVCDQIGGPTAAADIARAIWTMARAFHDGAPQSGIYHFSGAPDISWAGFARKIFALADRSVTVQDILSADYPTQAKRPLNSRLDCRELEAVFAIPRPDWRQSLKDVLKDLT